MRELNLDNMAEFLNTQEFRIDMFGSGSLSREYKRIGKLMIDFFYDEHTIKCIENNRKNQVGSSMYLNDKYVNVEFYKITLIDFEYLYPSITVKLYEENKIYFSVEEFGYLYTFLLKNKYKLYNHPNITEECKRGIRYMLFGLYGCSQVNGYICVSDIDLVTATHKEFVDNLYLGYNDDIIYLDIDIIYLKNRNPDIMKLIVDYGIPFEEDDVSGIFFQKKRYFSERSGVQKYHGLDINRNRTRLQDFYDSIDVFKYNLKIYQRREKLTKLKQKIKDGRIECG